MKGKNRTEASRAFLCYNPPPAQLSLPPEETHFLFHSFFLRLKMFLSFLLRCKSTCPAMALRCTWHLSREKVDGCQPGHGEPVWVIRVMEICMERVFPREFQTAFGYVPEWEYMDLQGLYEGRQGAASPAWFPSRDRGT